MKRTALLGLSIVVLGAVLFWGLARDAEHQLPPPEVANWPDEGRPNVLLIVTDDQRWDQLGLVQGELGDVARYSFLETPNLDALANDGVRFRNAFVTTSLCSPSRASILTGQYVHRHGVMDNQTAFPDVWNFASALRDAGYSTAYFGKWHHGRQPERPGFECYASFLDQGKYLNTRFLVNRRFPLCGNAEPRVQPTEGYVDDESIDFLVEFLNYPRNKPFAVMLGLKGVHQPFLPKAMHQGSYQDRVLSPPGNWQVKAPWSTLGATPRRPPGNRDIWLDILETIRGIDHSVGRVLGVLEEKGLADNTLVIFTSDNGYYLGEHRLGDKRSAYEESIRVPLLLRLPNKIEPGLLRDELVLNIDIAPTILDYAGVEVSEAVQGVSLAALSGAGSREWRTDFLYQFWEQPFNNAPRADGTPLTPQVVDTHSTPTMLSVRSERHKLTVYKDLPEYTELFDLHVDPAETLNLAREESASVTLEAMCARLQRLLKETEYDYLHPIKRWLEASAWPDKPGSIYGDVMASGEQVQFQPEC